MGRYSFQAPGSRYGLQPWFRVGNIDVTTSVLVAVMAVVSLIAWAIDPDITARLWLLPSEVRGGEVWRIVTWPMANANPDLWTALGIALFWYFGTELESRLGRNKFAFLVGAIVVVPGLIATAIDAGQAGFRPIHFAVFLLFIGEYPYARFFFGIPAWVLGVVFLGLELINLAGARAENHLVVFIASLATAALVARSYGLLSSFPWIPAIPLPGGEARPKRPKRSKRPKRPGSSRVVEGPWGTSSRTGPMPTPPNSASVSDQIELDTLLDKINAGGIDSLTHAEKRRLNELSKRLRDS